MNRSIMQRVVGLCLVAALGLSGCASTKSTTEMASAGASLFSQLGGMNSVNALASAFGVNLANNPTINAALGAAGIDQAKLGLVNEIAKVSGMALPNPGADLMSALSGKGLGASGAQAVSQALSSAADGLKIGGEQKTALMGILDPITKQVAGQ